jgi:hypothetical protein
VGRDGSFSRVTLTEAGIDENGAACPLRPTRLEQEPGVIKCIIEPGRPVHAINNSQIKRPLLWLNKHSCAVLDGCIYIIYSHHTTSPPPPRCQAHFYPRIRGMEDFMKIKKHFFLLIDQFLLGTKNRDTLSPAMR